MGRELTQEMEPAARGVTPRGSWPTLTEFKRLCWRGHTGRALDPFWSSRWLYRPLSIRVSWIAARMGATSTVVTVAGGMCLLIAAVLYGTPVPAAWLAGAACVLTFVVLDHCDGEIARYERTTGRTPNSLVKEYLDTCAHAGEVAIVIGLGLGLYHRLGGPWWLLIVIVLRVFPGAIQPWQRYCEILVKEVRRNGRPTQDQLPGEMLEARSLLWVGRSNDSSSVLMKCASVLSRTMGSPDNLLTLIICTALDTIPATPQFQTNGVVVPYLLIWLMITSLHSAAAGIKSTIIYAGRLAPSIDRPLKDTDR